MCRVSRVRNVLVANRTACAMSPRVPIRPAGFARSHLGEVVGLALLAERVQAPVGKLTTRSITFAG
jgi:hypothetical protein